MTELKKSGIRDQVNTFLSSPGYIFCILALASLGNMFSLELPVYILYTLLCVYICIWGEDLRGLMPIIPACYITPAVSSNPGRNEAGVFSGVSGICILICGICIALGLVYYCIRNRKALFATKRRLLSGMLVLAGAYLLGGIGSGADLKKNLPFALAQGAALILPYFLFTGGIRWKHLRKDYLAWTFFCTGGALVAEILWIYLSGTVIVDGVINRDFIYTGWGIHNNIGFLLAMMIPSAFRLAANYRRGWIGTVVGSVFLIFVFLTCSRSSILGGCLVYALCVIFMLHFAKNRRHNTIALVTVLGAAALTILLFGDDLYHLFSGLLQIGMDPSNRDWIYAEGIGLFAQKPIFGNSFFSPGFQPWDWATLESFSQLFPPRWHNTIVQLLASCGITGLVCYGFHRIQTIRLFFSVIRKETHFYGCSALALVVCSLFDCHFFNIAPVLLYSIVLAATEYNPPIATEKERVQ